MENPLTDIRPLLSHAQAHQYAVGAFNCVNAETLTAIVEVAEELKAPVILISGPIEIPLIGPKWLARFAQEMAKDASIPICLHLDHGDSIETVKECIDAGFSSVMFDGSSYDFETNVRLTKEVVDYAHARGIGVEGEIGSIGRADGTTAEGTDMERLANPSEALEFAERTGVDALAVAIGNAHGMYKQLPQLDFERLTSIRKLTDIPLVLHGGSGTPLDQLQKAVSLGICKVNVASEMARAFMTTICQREASKQDNAWYTFTLREAKNEVKSVIHRWIHQLGAQNRVP